MQEGLSVVEWCGLCNSGEAHGTLTIVEPGTDEEIPIPCCIRCASNPELWEGGKMVLKERPDE